MEEELTASTTIVFGSAPVVTTPSVVDEIGAATSVTCTMIKFSDNLYSIKIKCSTGGDTQIRARIVGVNFVGKTVIGSVSAWSGESVDENFMWNSPGNGSVVVKTDGTLYINGNVTSNNGWKAEYSAVITVV